MAINPNGSANNFFDHRNKPIIENIQKVSVKDQFGVLPFESCNFIFEQLNLLVELVDDVGLMLNDDQER